VYPMEYDVQVEEVGPTLRFLHSALRFDEGGVDIQPYLCNAGFACGRSSVPLFSKLPRFCDTTTTPISVLRHYMFSKMFHFHFVLQGRKDNAMRCIVLLLCEVLLLQWPARAVANCCMGLSRSRCSSVLDYFRRVGGLLRRHASDTSCLLEILDEFTVSTER